MQWPDSGRPGLAVGAGERQRPALVALLREPLQAGEEEFGREALEPLLLRRQPNARSRSSCSSSPWTAAAGARGARTFRWPGDLARQVEIAGRGADQGLTRPSCCRPCRLKRACWAPFVTRAGVAYVNVSEGGAQRRRRIAHRAALGLFSGEQPDQQLSRDPARAAAGGTTARPRPCGTRGPEPAVARRPHPARGAWRPCRSGRRPRPTRQPLRRQRHERQCSRCWSLSRPPRCRSRTGRGPSPRSAGAGCEGPRPRSNVHGGRWP